MEHPAVADDFSLAALAWFEREHGAAPTLCMIEQGHRASEAVAARLGYTVCDRYEEKDERPLIVYRREAGQGELAGALAADTDLTT